MSSSPRHLPDRRCDGRPQVLIKDCAPACARALQRLCDGAAVAATELDYLTTEGLLTAAGAAHAWWLALWPTLLPALVSARDAVGEALAALGRALARAAEWSHHQLLTPIGHALWWCTTHASLGSSATRRRSQNVRWLRAVRSRASGGRTWR